MAGPTSRLSARHIVIDGIPLSLFQPKRGPSVRTSFQPASVVGQEAPFEAGSSFVPGEQSIVFDQFYEGAGFSRPQGRYGRAGYAYGLRANLRKGKVAFGSGYLFDKTPNAPTTYGAVTDSFKLSGHLFFLNRTRYVLRSVGGEAQVDVAKTLDAAFSATSAANFKGRVYVGGTGGDIYSVGPTLADWTNTRTGPDATVYPIIGAIRQSVSGRAAMRLFGVTGGAATFQHVEDDPHDSDDWSGEIRAGDGINPIQTVAVGPTAAWFCSASGVVEVDEYATAKNLTPWFLRDFHPNSGRASILLGDQVHVSHGRGHVIVNVGSGLLQSKPQWGQFGAFTGWEGPISGTPTAYANEGGWMAAAYYSHATQSSYVMYGKMREDAGIDGPGPILWHGAEEVISGEIITHMTVDTGSTNRPWLWICTADVDTPTVLAHIYQKALPRSGDPLVDFFAATQTGTYETAEDWSVYTARQDWGFPNDDKVLKRFNVRADRLSPGALILSSQIDNGDWTEQATMLSSLETDPLPASADSDGALRGREIGVLWRVTHPKEQPVLVYSVDARAKPIIESTSMRQYVLAMGESIPMRNGNPENRSPQLVLDQLVARVGDTVDMTNETGSELEVTIEQNIGAEFYEDWEGQGWLQTITLNVAINSSVARYDTDATYSGGDRWGGG